jgi:hypothetical protein
VRNLSKTARIVMASVAVLGILAFLVIAELGINAGLIHYGVKIGHLDVGGMSPVAAERLLDRVGKEMESAPVVFRGGALGTYSWLPSELGWEPRKFEMSQQAMNVGRKGNLLRSLSDRIKSWTQGVELHWAPPSRDHVDELADTVAQEAEERGFKVDLAELKARMLQATWDWPRKPFYEIPFES